ncbi:glutamine--fructose-6-phosphate transaminase (isomerizing) [Stomatohabitans albus]|uniref:glutamine--fructose-6-phosphate transaminase (isomerizing) n=1 Tax=Stomatohabitans albus TaxID=3110766 RepID=UPI00300D16E9
MCGIVGYVGNENASGPVLNGLATLEYRGYDSAGLATIEPGLDHLGIYKAAGKLVNLRQVVDDAQPQGTTAIGHTRWATHGDPTTVNAHPHTTADQRLAVVHNGIIENHLEVAAMLREEHGITPVSDTDTEIIAHLIGTLYTGDLKEAVRQATQVLTGQYAIGVIHRDHPDTIVAAVNGAPMVIGTTDDVAVLCSDVAGLLPYTRHITAVPDGHMAMLTPGHMEIFDQDGAPATGHTYEVDWTAEEAEKGGYPSFMAKEIAEQPRAVRDTMTGRWDGTQVHIDEVSFDLSRLKTFDKIIIVACGTSHHAGLVARRAFEHWTRLSTEVEIASEFRYRDPIVNKATLVVAISQSGETADTIAAMQYAQDQGATTLGVTNMVGSTLARGADSVIITRAGREVAVASTKAFTTQIVALMVAALWIGQARGNLYVEEIQAVFDDLQSLPDAMETVLAQDAYIGSLATALVNRLTSQHGYVMFFGRLNGLPIALEGALKLKEISYLHAEGFASGEMKHGPIALIEPGVTVIAIATEGAVKTKVMSNIEQVKGRGAHVIAIVTEGDDDVRALADDVIVVPAAMELASPILAVIPVQMLALHVANALDRDVDQPRNLAKTVTVE